MVIHATSLCATLVFASGYGASQASWPERKHRAWIITAIAAACASVCSLPFMYDLVRAQGNVDVLKTGGLGWRHLHAINTCAMFQGYLVADLLVGTVHYRDQLNPLTGWVHHLAYIFLMQKILSSHPEWASIFTAALIMELPTFLLGSARLFPHLRNDSAFSASFLATRIVLHVFMIVAYVSRREFMPSVVLSSAFPLHAMWFTKQVMMRVSPSSDAATVTTSVAETLVVSAEDEAAARALQSPPPELVASNDSSPTSTGPSTPEDDRPDPLTFGPSSAIDKQQRLQVDLHLLRHALASEQSLRIRAMLAAASRGRYAALAARARGLYRDAQTYAPTWRENMRNRVWGPSVAGAPMGTTLRREVLAN